MSQFLLRQTIFWALISSETNHILVKRGGILFVAGTYFSLRKHRSAKFHRSLLDNTSAIYFWLLRPSADPSQQQDYERMRQRRKGNPHPHPPLLPRNSYKYFACPPFFAQIIYPHTTPFKIIQTTLSFWRRQSLLSKRAISHPLPPKIVARSNLRPEETLRARGTKSG